MKVFMLAIGLFVSTCEADIIKTWKWGHHVQGCTPAGTEVGVEGHIEASTVSYYYSKNGDNIRTYSYIDRWSLALSPGEEVTVEFTVTQEENSTFNVLWLVRQQPKLFLDNIVGAEVTLAKLRGVSKFTSGHTKYTVRCVDMSDADGVGIWFYEIETETGEIIQVQAYDGELCMAVSSSQGGTGSEVYSSVTYSGIVTRTHKADYDSYVNRGTGESEYIRMNFNVMYKPGNLGGVVGEERKAVKRGGVTLKLLGSVFTREGYRQIGWVTDGGHVYELGGDYVLDDDLTLYPKWIRVYTITYKRGTPEVKGTESKAIKTEGETIKLLGSVFTREEYRQTGWLTASGKRYGLGVDYAEDSDLILYPDWTRVGGKYTVAFRANGGEGQMDSVEWAYGVSHKLPKNTFRKQGFVFAGWSNYGVDPTVDHVNFKDEDSVEDGQLMIARDRAVLWAVWVDESAANTYKITYQDLFGTTHANPASYAKGMSFSLAPPSARDGYVFAGWMPPSISSDMSGDQIVRATWIEKTTSDEHLYCVIDLSGGMLATSYPVSYLKNIPAGGWTDAYKTTKLVMRRIDPGAFEMQGKHDVTLTKPFYMGVFELTQKQYELVTGTNPSYNKGDRRPVEKVSYDDIRGCSLGALWPHDRSVDPKSFIGRLQSKTGLNLDLPTEAQWEYACRAGTTTKYSYGDLADEDYMWCDSNALSQTQDVGMRLPNPWGLYDMHGNVWEWCLDWEGSIGSSTDPAGASSGSRRMRRGGGFYDKESASTSSSRGGNSPTGAYSDLGFRLSYCPSRTIVTVSYDANGGSCMAVKREIARGAALAGLPVAERAGHVFDGWFTAAGAPIVEGMVVSADLVLFAHWTEVRSKAHLYCVIDMAGGASAASYPVHYLSETPVGGWSDAHKTTNLVLRYVAPGTFKMQDQHDVALTNPYYMGIFEVTQKQYELVTGVNPASHNGDMLPVEMVAYNDIRGSALGAQWPKHNFVDATSFLGRLRAKTGLDFDLPTEAQWEYACRAGTTTKYSYGDLADEDYMWCDSNALSQTQDVGMRLPNPWGLYDMHGNVWEWCLDWEGSIGSSTDPAGASSGSRRMRRGGGSHGKESDSTSSSRGSNKPTGAYTDLGFRLSRTLSLSGPTKQIAIDVQFEAGEGTGPVRYFSFESGNVFKLPNCTFTPPTDKRFAGWACSNGKRYDDGMLVFDLAKPGETVTMTAIWE